MTAEPEDDDAPDPSRHRRAVFGLLIMVIAVAAVLFVVHQLQQAARMQDCVASGRTNCAPIDTTRR